MALADQLSRKVRLLFSSWGRIFILAALLVGWTAGVSFAISHLSPIDDLVRTAPIEPGEKNSKDLDRLTVQSELATELFVKSQDLLDQYQGAANQILEKIASHPDWMPEIIRKLLSDTSTSSLVMLALDSRDNPAVNDGSLSRQILSVRSVQDYQYSDPNFPELDKIESIRWAVRQPSVVLEQKLKDNDNEFRDTQRISVSSVVSPEQRSIVSVKILDRDNQIALFNMVGEEPVLFKDNEEELARFLTDQIGKFEIELPVSIEKSFFDNDTIYRLAEDIALAIQNHLASLEKQTSNYRQASYQLEQRRSELESRMRSSPELFAVSVFRASLITIVVVSVGFVLLRAFAAELTQARRQASSELAVSIVKQFPPAKLERMPEIIRAISGDNQPKGIVSDGAPPDAVATAGKLGDAVSKFAAAAKKAG